MKKARILLTTGVWVAILPYLGFPFFWKNILLTITGLALVFLAYILYREEKTKTGDVKEKTFDNFSENKNFNDENNFN